MTRFGLWIFMSKITHDFWLWVFDEGTESVDIATNENILLLDEYSKVKLF